MNFSNLELLQNYLNGPFQVTEVELDEISHAPLFPDRMKHLWFRRCYNLETVGVKLPESLEELGLDNCGVLSLPSLPRQLNTLSITSCHKLTDIPDLPRGLKVFRLGNCSGLKYLPSLPDSIEEIEILGCSTLRYLPRLPASLKRMTINQADKVENLPELPPSLQSLQVANLKELRRIGQLPDALHRLVVKYCPLLQDLPTLPPQLRMLLVGFCQRLEKVELSPALLDLSVASCENLLSIDGDCPIVQRFCAKNLQVLGRLPDLPAGVTEVEIHGCPQMWRGVMLGNTKLLLA